MGHEQLVALFFEGGFLLDIIYLFYIIKAPKLYQECKAEKPCRRPNNGCKSGWAAILNPKRSPQHSVAELQVPFNPDIPQHTLAQSLVDPKLIPRTMEPRLACPSCESVNLYLYKPYIAI